MVGSEYCCAEIEAAHASTFCKAVVPVFSGQYLPPAKATPSAFKDPHKPETQAIRKAFGENVIDVHNPAHQAQVTADIKQKIVERFCTIKR